MIAWRRRSRYAEDSAVPRGLLFMNRMIAAALMAVLSETLLSPARALGPDDGQPPDFVDSLADARLLLSAAKYSEAEVVLRKSAEGRKNAAPASADDGATLDLLGVLYTTLGSYVQADDCLRDAAAIFKHLPGQSARYADALTHRAKALQLRADYAAAEKPIGEALEVLANGKLEKSTEYAKALAVLADVQWAQGKYSQARDTYLRAIELFKAEASELSADCATHCV